ncbi:TPA: glycosyltransferase family 4 protein [Pseudomonas aeruginosa]
MRIGFVAHAWIPGVRGGSEIMGHELAKALVKRGHDVTVYAPEMNATVKLDGVAILGGRACMVRLNHDRHDVIVAQHKLFRQAYSIAKAKRSKIVGILHNDNSMTWRDLTLSADLWVSNTEWLRDELGVQSLVVHPIVHATEHATRRGNHVTLVNLIPAKGSGLFYELARRMPDVQFLGVQGGYGKQVIQRLPNVRIIPTTQDMRRDVWAHTRILLMPSEYESYGMAGVEAMASGIPVIAHPTLGLRESLGDAGIFIERDEPDAWEREIRRLLADDEAESKAAKARSAEIDSGAEVEEFCRAVEAMAGCHH